MTGDELFGIATLPIIRQEIKPPVFGRTLVVGEWTTPKPDQAQEISEVSSGPTSWKLIQISQ